MSIDRLINAMKGHAGAMDGQGAQSRIGTVSAFDPVRHLVRVMLQPENVQSGWLPLGALMVGGGFGIVAAPTIGQQALVVPQEGDADSGHVICGVYSAAAMPPVAPSAPSGGSDQNGNTPTNAQSGEVLFVSKFGAVIRFCSDGSIYLKGPTLADGDALQNGNIQATKNVEVGSGASGSFTTPTGQIVTVKDGIVINIF
jgi:hypothetical protein